jgi:hypothetical protein
MSHEWRRLEFGIPGILGHGKQPQIDTSLLCVFKMLQHKVVKERLGRSQIVDFS